MALVFRAFLVATLPGQLSMVAGGSAFRAARAAKLTSLRGCDENLEGVEAEMVGIWHDFEGGSVVAQRAGEISCTISEGTGPTRFEVVEGKGEMICASQVATPQVGLLTVVGSVPDDLFQVEEFEVGGGLPGTSSSRNVATAWPEEACTPDKLCPLVVLLHGGGERGTDAGTLANWGPLNYYKFDAACRKGLGSVIVLPQIAEEESWGVHGPAIFEHFVMPLVEGLLQKNGGLDRDRVALAGYSLGGIGAAIGASLYPNVFSVLAAASPAMYPEEWEAAKANFALPPVAGEGVTPRLRQIAIAYAEKDCFDIGVSMRTIMGMFERNGLLLSSAVNLRLYRGIAHMAASEAFFNHWKGLHELLWLGHFDTQLS